MVSVSQSAPGSGTSTPTMSGTHIPRKSGTETSEGFTASSPPSRQLSLRDKLARFAPIGKRNRKSGGGVGGENGHGSRAASADEAYDRQDTKGSSVSGTDKSVVKAARAAEQEQLRRAVLVRRQESDLRASQIETPEQRGKYGQGIPPSGWADDEASMLKLQDVKPEQVDSGSLYKKQVVLRARVHAKRAISPHLGFLVLRQQHTTLQAVIAEEAGSKQGVTQHMVRWAERLHQESIVFVRGDIVKPKVKVIGASIHEAELHVTDLFLVAAPTVELPFSVYEADRPPAELVEQREGLRRQQLKVANGNADSDEESDPERDVSESEEERIEGSDAIAALPSHAHQHVNAKGASSSRSPPALTKRVRLTNRVLDLRSPASQSIFRIQSLVSTIFRTSLLMQGFLEIHTPKLQAGSSESGSSVFQLDYFGRPAFLAQSPQLYKQLAISSDLQRVFEVGPVFRAENSNTSRHLTEYTGLDVEMQIIRTYHEAIKVIDAMLKDVFGAIRKNMPREEQIVRDHFGGGECVWIEETPILTFQEGIRMLRESGWKEEDGSDPSEDEDLATRTEHRLCELVKEKYGTDYFILDKFPVSARPFYTMPDPELPGFTNSFDIFLRGTEISSGGQRIHDAKELEDNIRHMGLDTRALQEYLDGFRYGMSPHAGCGFGLERIVTTFLGLGDVRWASLFHRDPRSLPADNRPPPLRHADADTVAIAAQLASSAGASNGAVVREAPKLELAKLVANYGASSNTSWLDERFSHWQDPLTGAVVGYVKRGKFAIIVGDPLCDVSQSRQVIEGFLNHLKTPQIKLNPLWLLIKESTEEVLASRFNWSSVSCIVEQRVPKEGRQAALAAGDMERKLRKAEKEGLKIEEIELKERVPDAIKKEVQEKIEEWKKSREGKKQLHLTEVDPFQDELHRVYFISRTKEAGLQAMVVLAQLAPQNGWQIKWSLDFPNAINGAIESTIVRALETYSTDPFTFGAAAGHDFEAVHGVGTLSAKALSKTFKTVVGAAGLHRKNEFRYKIGAKDEKLYITFPRHGLRGGGIRRSEVRLLYKTSYTSQLGRAIQSFSSLLGKGSRRKSGKSGREDADSAGVTMLVNAKARRCTLTITITISADAARINLLHAHFRMAGERSDPTGPNIELQTSLDMRLQVLVLLSLWTSCAMVFGYLTGQQCFDQDCPVGLCNCYSGCTCAGGEGPGGPPSGFKRVPVAVSVPGGNDTVLQYATALLAVRLERSRGKPSQPFEGVKLEQWTTLLAGVRVNRALHTAISVRLILKRLDGNKAVKVGTLLAS
ncbi:aspartyl-tRNA synthetase [Ceraceosorus guamensis]|uniref:Probable aspartate--tRNA ligase, cytoplasmic n=1 Tax=Ceraceosorus guamensis TaxID=1522189 RepID=A0A316W2A6_9BASI|nr:aspartyl-tRNA synthetase [Ceraceosorus guamensis]PWN43882.1 aspartyl-tRNA synthetase [Ceraceosorus guamensis]